ncbi:MAG: hypothetical protein ACTSU4_07050 [Promethearchaeota archaeon]
MLKNNLDFLALLSGGFDSPIASYLMIRNGFTPNFITFLISESKLNEFKEKILVIVNTLMKYSKHAGRVFFIKHAEHLREVQKKCDRKLTCILCKRLMLRKAIKLAQKRSLGNIIVTGDILGEQASQTLDNLYSYNDLIQNFILLRPLISWDKLDVMTLSQKIGIYEYCAQKIGSCGFNPKYPETHAKRHDINNAEKNLNIQDIIHDALDSMEIIKL